MICLQCENDARAICRFCGRAVCESHIQTKEFHAGYGKSKKSHALDRGSELIEERSQRRQQMVDQLTVKYLETAEKAKARRALEKQNVTKAAQFFKQNNLPPELLERAILSAKSPDDIFENAMTMGSQWQRARTNEQTRGMFSGPADQFDRDYSEGYSDLQRMTERLSTGPTEDIRRGCGLSEGRRPEPAGLRSRGPGAVLLCDEGGT